MRLGLPWRCPMYPRAPVTAAASGTSTAGASPANGRSARGISSASVTRPCPKAASSAVLVSDLNEREAVLAANPTAFFTLPHFDGYSAVLTQLMKVTEKALQEAIVDGWLACATRGSSTNISRPELDRTRMCSRHRRPTPATFDTVKWIPLATRRPIADPHLRRVVPRPRDQPRSVISCMVHRGPEASARRRSTVHNGQSSASARAT
jgi:hypothetical protein